MPCVHRLLADLAPDPEQTAPYPGQVRRALDDALLVITILLHHCRFVVLELEGLDRQFEQPVLQHVLVRLLHLDLVQHLELDFLGCDGRLRHHVDEVGDREEVREEDQVLQLHRLDFIHVFGVDRLDRRRRSVFSLLLLLVVPFRLGGVVLQLTGIVNHRLLRLVDVYLDLWQISGLFVFR